MARALRSWLERHATPGGWCLMALAFCLPFVLGRAQRGAFDTPVHLFFADHYRQTWWSLWEPRWYLGFSVASYPPLTHQLIALGSWPMSALIAAFAPGPEPYPGAFRWWGAEAVFVGLLLAVAALLPVAVRAYARIFVGPRAAAWAATLAVALPALHLAAWSFGQLPTLAATTVILLALARGVDFVHSGRRAALAQAIALAAVAAATHHAVFLFVPFAAGAGLAQLWVRRRAAAAPVRLVQLARSALWGAASALVVALVLWPFLQWSQGQRLQTPIDHLSRHNFLLDPVATLYFFWPVYGPLLLLIPSLWRWRSARRWPLAAAWALLFCLSLGGTTPLPRWLFGAGWEWLTYDRFGLWAAILFLPVAGAALPAAWRRAPGWALAWTASLAAASVLAGWLAGLAQAQPPPVDMASLARFLNEPAQRPYRYLTLGFGDQLAQLSAVTANGTPDGTYHTARGLPELRASGLGALDTAVWSPLGAAAVKPFLENPQRYGVRWVFAHHPAYVPVLLDTGWRFRFFIGPVMVWERADVRPLPLTPPAEDRFAAAWWGTAPLTALALAALALAWPGRRWLTRARVVAALAWLRRAGWVFTFALLALWWVYRVRAGAGDLPQIYFVYQSVLIYAAEAAAALTVASWLAERGLRGERLHLGPRGVAWAGAGLIAAVAVSAARSADPALTVTRALHGALLAGWYLLLVNDPPGRTLTGWVLALAVLTQSIVAAAQALTQSTAGLAGLHLPWPGTVTAATRGASVVASAEGARWLRAYGTLPHPNILGAFLLVYLSGLLAQYLADGRRRWLAGLGAGAFALALTFSRAAWLGALGMALAVAGMARASTRPRLKVAGAVMALTALLTLAPLAGWLAPRLGLAGPANDLERASTLERTLLIGFSLDAWRAQPLTGVGAGAFPQWAARNTGAGYPFEPVHNVPLLILAETGVVGAAAALALVGAVAGRIWRRRGRMEAAEAAWAAGLVGLLITGLFDHLWWTQPPARILAVLVLAQWARAAAASEAQP